MTINRSSTKYNQSDAWFPIDLCFQNTYASITLAHDPALSKIQSFPPPPLDNPFYNLWPKLFKSKVGLPTNLRVD